MKKIFSFIEKYYTVPVALAALYFARFVYFYTMVNVGVNFDSPQIFHNEHVLWDVLISIVLIVAGTAVCRFIRFKKTILASNVIRVTLMVVLAVSVFRFISHSDPQLLKEDSAVCYSAASAIDKGQYAVIQEGGYVYRFPNMLGVISMNRLFFRIFGDGNEQGYYYYNALMLLLTVWFGAAFIRMVICGKDFRGKVLGDGSGMPDEKTEKISFVAESLWMIFAVFNFSLQILVLFRYGDMTQLASLMIAFYCAVRYLKTGKVWLHIAVLAVLSLGVLVRENTLVGCIALLIFYLLDGVRTEKWKRALILMLTVVLVMIVPSRVQRSCYESLAGEKINGIPYIAWIAMGMQENSYAGPGWFNSYNWMIFDDFGGAEGAEAESRAYIRERLRQFADDPGMMIDFYRRKLVTQWADPTYGALDHIAFGENADPFYAQSTGQSDSGNIRQQHLMRFLGVLQRFAYLGGAVFMIVFAVQGFIKNGKRPDDMMLILIALTGGVLFSLFWEAKSRYVVGWFEFILLCASLGYSYLFILAGDRITRGLKKKRKTE
ncbi:MAG: glycosyltransferase family 39 protein [Lachnospiraceae bacterium]|nr:glycosyltransferase family 39 protein [Lachnospiraceae bacterium]